MRKWLPAVPIAAGYALSLIVWPQLPDAIVPDWQAILPVPADSAEPMPRAVVAFLFPTIALALWIILSAGAHIRGRLFKDAIHRFTPTYTAIAAWVVSLVVLLHALMLSTVVGGSSQVPAPRYAFLATMISLISAALVAQLVTRSSAAT